MANSLGSVTVNVIGSTLYIVSFEAFSLDIIATIVVEFELLSLLASKPGKVFKRDEILDKVWGNEVVVGGRTIDVHIRKLREKIGDKSFKTVKGVGYKFVD